MPYDIEYRGYRIRGSGQTGYVIHKDDRLVGGQNYMKDAKAWIDEDIIERDVSPDTVLHVIT